jgi:hypothetical protein
MMRPTMQYLVREVRRLIGDDGPTSERVWTDEELEQFLDTYRTVVVRAPLEPSFPVPTRIWKARYPYWEQGARLSVNGIDATVVTEDSVYGEWELALETSGPVTVTGRTYDVYAAAADALEAWAAREKLAYDITLDGQSLHRGQVGERLLSLAQTYRRQARPRQAAVIRSDLEVGAWY